MQSAIGSAPIRSFSAIVHFLSVLAAAVNTWDFYGDLSSSGFWEGKDQDFPPDGL
jgi:hypothetical protein